jgi:sodium-dependent dicarboxylate transporter 2/3/5
MDHMSIWQLRPFQIGSRLAAASILAIAVTTVIWLVPSDLSSEGKLALWVMSLSVIGWMLTKINDTVVALTAVMALLAVGIIEPDAMFKSLGHELIWLLIASFVMAAVLRKSGLVECAMQSITTRITSITPLFYALAICIALTALVVPSTSGRAALLLPIFLAIADRIDNPRVVRALALLFPTAILLSAGGFLTGAGAHAVAVEFLAKEGRTVDFLGWILLALPFSAISTLAATFVVLNVFLTANERSMALRADGRVLERLDRRQRAIVAVVAMTIALWLTVPVHGYGIVVIALGSMLVLLSRRLTDVSVKDAFKSVEIELLVFLAATFVLAKSLSQSGADTWMARQLVEALPSWFTGNGVFVMAFVAVASLMAHLVITSRTARASVLIPLIVVPMSALGHDLTTLVMISILGTGFCQTLTASSKPVALFANISAPTYGQSDLVRLSICLFPIMFGLLIVFAVLVWA